MNKLCSSKKCIFTKNGLRCKFHAYLCIEFGCNNYISEQHSYCTKHNIKCVMDNCLNYSNKYCGLCNSHYNDELRKHLKNEK